MNSALRGRDNKAQWGRNLSQSGTTAHAHGGSMADPLDPHERHALAARMNFTRPDGTPMRVDEVIGYADGGADWVNTDAQKAQPNPPPVVDRPIPVYLRVGRNLLTPDAFQIAARKLLPAHKVRVVRAGDPVVKTALEEALESGRFSVYGVECARVNESSEAA